VGEPGRTQPLLDEGEPLVLLAERVLDRHAHVVEPDLGVRRPDQPLAEVRDVPNDLDAAVASAGTRITEQPAYGCAS